ncbi:MAG: tetratricopeptide repeat protein [Myxococcales bacterium]|nr:tetratricopeptide repeat protein [Myxococcales bacterium]
MRGKDDDETTNQFDVRTLGKRRRAAAAAPLGEDEMPKRERRPSLKELAAVRIGPPSSAIVSSEDDFDAPDSATDVGLRAFAPDSLDNSDEHTLYRAPPPRREDFGDDAPPSVTTGVTHVHRGLSADAGRGANDPLRATGEHTGAPPTTMAPGFTVPNIVAPPMMRERHPTTPDDDDVAVTEPKPLVETPDRRALELVMPASSRAVVSAIDAPSVLVDAVEVRPKTFGDDDAGDLDDDDTHTNLSPNATLASPRMRAPARVPVPPTVPAAVADPTATLAQPLDARALFEEEESDLETTNVTAPRGPMDSDPNRTTVGLRPKEVLEAFAAADAAEDHDPDDETAVGLRGPDLPRRDAPPTPEPAEDEEIDDGDQTVAHASREGLPRRDTPAPAHAAPAEYPAAATDETAPPALGSGVELDPSDLRSDDDVTRHLDGASDELPRFGLDDDDDDLPTGFGGPTRDEERAPDPGPAPHELPHEEALARATQELPPDVLPAYAPRASTTLESIERAPPPSASASVDVVMSSGAAAAVDLLDADVEELHDADVIEETDEEEDERATQDLTALRREQEAARQPSQADTPRAAYDPFEEEEVDDDATQFLRRDEAMARFAPPPVDPDEHVEDDATRAISPRSTPRTSDVDVFGVTQHVDADFVSMSEQQLLAASGSSPEHVRASDADVELLSDSQSRAPSTRHVRASDDDIEIISEDASWDDERTAFFRRDAEILKGLDASRRAAPAPPEYSPPPVVAERAFTPAHEVDPDEEEEELQRRGAWDELCELYLARLRDARAPAERVALLKRLASVNEHVQEDAFAAFKSLSEAFDLAPEDEELVTALEKVARALGRLSDIAERGRRNLPGTKDVDARLALLGHLVFWHERWLNRPSEVAPFINEIERLDKTHPIALRRAAQNAAAQGDVKAQREYLARAMVRLTRPEQRLAFHLALAGAWANTPESQRHYEQALAIDPDNVVALQGLERIGRDADRHQQVRWSLERQVEVVQTDAERVAALLKLAELHERKYLRRDDAAQMLERVLEYEPSNHEALKALERCYHALRDWPGLVRVLRARADHSLDKAQKVEVLELVAEVYGSKMEDTEGAIEVLRDIVFLQPKHRRAIADLARLYEKIGDWGNVASYRGRLAELSPDKRAQSQALVQVGDFLSHPDRDPIAARLQYEKAVGVDPTNAAAWEALQKIAKIAGDDRRVAHCLEQRAKHTDSPRQKALVLVELAEHHRGTGDDKAARNAYEAAIRADATNESAATAMLEVFVREERWQEAAPLCELLVNGAVRDQDHDALFKRLRLATRISAALGDAERAVSAALAALEARPEDPGAQADLVSVCAQCHDQPNLLRKAKKALSDLGRNSSTLAADTLIKLAEIQRSAGDPASAADTLRRALEQEPAHADAKRVLAELVLEQGDFAVACKLKLDLARNATNADTKFAALVEVGEIWARRAKELERATAVFEEARGIKPLDHWLLHTLMWLYGELKEWDKLEEVLRAIVEIQESPDRKAKSILAMAQLVRDQRGDLRRAAELFDQVLDYDKSRLDAFESLVRCLTEAKDWQLLERMYRKMIGRVKDDESQRELRFALFSQLGLIYRDRLGDASRALEALEAARRMKTTDTKVRKIVLELLVVTDQLDEGVRRVRELLAASPHDPELYVELYDLFLRQRYFDKAWCAADVIACIGKLTPQQQQFHGDYGPMPLHEVPGQILEQAWRTHLLHQDLDPVLTQLFAVMTPAVARMRHAQLRPEQLVRAVGRPFTPTHSSIFELIHRTFGDGGEILGIPKPDLLLGDPSSTIPFYPALAPYGAMHVAVPAAEATADAIIFHAGKRLAERRPELAARAFFPSVPDLTGLLAGAVRVGTGERSRDPNAAQLDAQLMSVLAPNEHEAIRSIVMRATSEGAQLDVRRWLQAADLSSMRAALLLAGDVVMARRAMASDPQTPGDLPPRERIGELFLFATSDLYADLRGAIGVAVEA